MATGSSRRLGQPPTNAVVIVCGGCTAPASIMLWGDQSLVFIGPNCYLPGGALHSGDGASIVIEEGNTCTYAPDLNARNGGLIWAAPDGLWSTGVRFLTDDMHAILDLETGRRVNTFGGHIRIERHVWLGMETMLLPGAFIGHDSIIGARSVVSGHLPSHSICVGTPARVIRSGVTWSRDDTPPA